MESQDPQGEQTVDLSEGGSRRRWFSRRTDSTVTSTQSAVHLRPAPRDIPSTSAALDMARDWMRYFAFLDAGVSSGPENLISSSRGLAYLESDPRGVGTQKVMEGHRLATMAGKYCLVFSLGGFSAGAIRWANKNATALFEFDEHGQVKPVSDTAKTLLGGSDRRHLARMATEDLSD
jgi:hypothetical protein